MPDLPPSSLTALPLSGLDPTTDLVLVWDSSASVLSQMSVREFLLNRYAWINMPDAATLASDCKFGLNTRFEATITASRVLGTPANPTDGVAVTFRIKQGGTGSNGLSFSLYTVPSDVNVTPSTAVGTTDFATAVYISAGNKWVVLAYTKGAVGI